MTFGPCAVPFAAREIVRLVEHRHRDAEVLVRALSLPAIDWNIRSSGAPRRTAAI
jgi:hypothetical protein